MKSNNDKINIRKFISDDIEWIVQKHVDLYGDECGFDSTFKDYVAKPIYEFKENFDKEKENIWIVDVNGNPEGVIAIVKVDNETAQLRWFLINSEMRGKGLGRKLMSVVIEFCKEKKYKHIYLWTVSLLKTARHLYKSYGFELTEEKKHILWGRELTEERWDLNIHDNRN